MPVPRMAKISVTDTGDQDFYFDPLIRSLVGNWRFWNRMRKRGVARTAGIVADPRLGVCAMLHT